MRLPIGFVIWKRELIEKIQMKVAWVLPKWLVKWASVRMISHATTGKYDNTIVPYIRAIDALARWDEEMELSHGEGKGC